MERPPLPNVLVTFDTICVVDVMGIKDPELLRQALLGTLWEHDYLRGRLDIVISSNPDKLSMNTISSEELFSLCQNCGGSLKLFARQRRALPMAGAPMYIRSPPWYQAPDVVVTVFSQYEKKFLCDVELAGAETVGTIMDRIVKELQYRHYYLPKGGTRPTSEHQSTGCQDDGPAAAFYGHFREDIGPDGSLKLFVNAYQARAAKRIIKQRPRTNDLNITEQVLPRIVVTIVARQNLVCTVVLTGIDDPPIIRQRIIEALRFYEYFIEPDLVITQTYCCAEVTYEPLTDNGLFSLCREQGDKYGSLKLFVEASPLVYASEVANVRPERNPLPKIVISVLDWDSQHLYFDMNMTGLEFHKVYEGLCKEVETRLKMKVVRIYGPEPDTWFSWENLNYHLFDLIQAKGASKGSLKLFVALQEQPHQQGSPAPSPSPRPLSVPPPKTGKHSRLDRLKSRLAPH
ncbi:hypothetical protein BYT27DRAFT_7204437 [Phlegmacium glaucopus]|nr:hypothetical protein BYT27DRAFT_7204437 [Phlegmacium glaucopus]